MEQGSEDLQPLVSRLAPHCLQSTWGWYFWTLITRVEVYKSQTLMQPAEPLGVTCVSSGGMCFRNLTWVVIELAPKSPVVLAACLSLALKVSME